MTTGATKLLEVLLRSFKRRLGFLGGSLKLSEGLICNSKQRPGKSAPFLLFLLSYDVEGVDGLRTFSLAGFLV